MSKSKVLRLTMSICVAVTLSGCVLGEHQSVLGENQSPDKPGEPNGKTGKEINNDPRRPGKEPGGPHRNPIGDTTTPPTPPTPPVIPPVPQPPTPNRAPAVIAPSADELSNLSNVFEHLFDPVSPSLRAEMGIGGVSEHPTAKIISGFGPMLELYGFFVGLEAIDNANTAREAFRRTLAPGERKFLLYRHNGAGQLETWPVRSMNDTPMDWNPATMFIEPITGLNSDGQRIYDSTAQTLQARYMSLKATRTVGAPPGTSGPIIGPPVPTPAPILRPKPCSGKHCVHDPK